MKLLFATGIYPPEIGGPAGYVKGVATELASQGHEVAVVTYGDEKTEAGANYKVQTIKRNDSLPVRYLKYAYQTWKLARKSDLIYTQGPVSEGLPAAIASILSRKPLILKVVGDYAWEQYQQTRTTNIEHRTSNHEPRTTNQEHGTLNIDNRSTHQIGQDSKFQVPSSKFELLDEFVTHRHKGKIWLMEAVERWVASRAKQIIVPSKYLKTVVEKWGIESEKIKVIYNSISPLPEIQHNLSKSPLIMGDLLNSHPDKGGMGGCSKLILTAVRAVPWKGGDFLCDVIKDLPAEYTLAVAGDGPELENWKKYAQEIGVADRVMWLGRLSRAELTEWYHTAHLFVLATGYEGFPHVVVEAASTGLPCIVSNKGGNPEIAELFPGLVTVAEYRDKNTWVETIASSNVKRQTSNGGLPESLGFGRMVGETVGVLESAQCLNLDSRDLYDSHDYSNHNICDELSEKSRFEVRNSKFDVSRVLSIGLEKKLFEEGKVRDRIVNQLDGFDATVIVFAKQKFDEQIAPNLRVISTNSWNKFFYVTDALRIVWKLRKQNFAVITSQDPTETGLVAYLASKLCKSALAIQDHGYHFHGNYYRQESWLNQFRYLFARFVITRADAIRVVSQRTEEALIKLGIAKDKIIRFSLTLDSKFLVSNSSSSSVNSDQWTVTDDAHGSARYEIRDTRYYLVVCRFVPIKRIDLAIHAFSIFAKQNPDVNLKIVGAGPLEDQIKQWIANFDLQSRVEIIPWTNDLAELYRGAIATLITSDREGFGMTAVESLACGTPVIMTDVGCAGEVVKNNENGIIIPVGDVVALTNAMEQILQLPITNYQLPMSEAYGINSTTESADQGQVSDAKYEIRNTSPEANAPMEQKYDSVLGMKVFLLSAICYQLSAKKKEDEDFWKFSEKNNKNEKQEKKNILVCVQAVDKNDALMGFFVDWLAEASKQFSQITVLALRVGGYDLPNNIKVIALRQKDSKSKTAVFKNLILKSWKYRQNYDGVFVRGDCVYVLLAGWFWRVMGKKVVFWYAHYKTNKCVPWAAKIANIVVTSVPEACNHPKVKAVPIGQAINSEKFKPNDQGEFPNGVKRFLVFGRVSEVKKVVDIIKGFKQANPENSTLTIIGKALTEDYSYLVKLAIGESNNIKWIDEDVPYEKVPSIYHQYDVLINATPGSLDKTIVEAAMSGLIIMSTSPGSNNLYTKDTAWLHIEDIDSLKEVILKVTTAHKEQLNYLGFSFRESAKKEHSQVSQIKLLSEIFLQI